MSFWHSKNVLITGGAGFIGSHLSNKLSKKGAKVSVLDSNSRKSSTKLYKKIDYNIHAARPNNEGVDLKYIPWRAEWYFGEADIVIHLASRVGGIGLYTSKPFEVINENCKIDDNVLECVLKYCKKDVMFFYASSSHIYPKDLQTSTTPPAIREDQAYPADSELSYGWAKLFFEKKLEYLAQQNKDIKIAVARYIGIYGPGQDIDLKTGSVIPVFSHRAVKDKFLKFRVWGTGKETRSYCHISDALTATIKMIEAMEHTNFVGPYNVGRQELTSISDIAEKIVKISGKDIDIKYDTKKKTLIWGQWCDCSKIKDELGWEAKVSLDKGLKTVYNDVKQRLEDGCIQYPGRLYKK